MDISTSNKKFKLQSVEVLDVEKQQRFFIGQDEPLICRAQIWITDNDEGFEEVFDSRFCNAAYLRGLNFSGPTIVSDLIVHETGDIEELTAFLAGVVNRIPPSSIESFRLAFAKVGRSEHTA